MSSVLQQVEQRLLAEAYKGDAERDDALMRLLEAVIKALQGTAGEQASRAAPVAERRFQVIYILSATGDESRPYRGQRLQNVTTPGVLASLRGAGVSSILAKADLPDRFEDTDIDPEELNNVALENFTLEEGGEYIPLFIDSDLHTAVKALRGWRIRLTCEDENAASEQADMALGDLGYAGAARNYSPKQVRIASRDVIAEVDAAASMTRCVPNVQAIAPRTVNLHAPHKVRRHNFLQENEEEFSYVHTSRKGL